MENGCNITNGSLHIYLNNAMALTWQVATQRTVLRRAVPASPTTSTTPHDLGNTNNMLSPDDCATPAAKRRKGTGPQAGMRGPSGPRAPSSRRTKCAHLHAQHMQNRPRNPAR